MRHQQSVAARLLSKRHLAETHIAEQRFGGLQNRVKF
jgi:hypothetical protein